jgi:hypothetical protein
MTAIQLARLAAIYGASADALLFGRESIEKDLAEVLSRAGGTDEKSPR